MKGALSVLAYTDDLKRNDWRSVIKCMENYWLRNQYSKNEVRGDRHKPGHD